ncbi:MAG TPA: CBS domain-containing protein, partial [Thermofilum sp.]|nr:CBS domain-containing protein [Thermofilum sp.]
ADIFSRQRNTLHPSDGISLAAEILANKDVKSLVIVDERDFIVGILTKSDLLSYLLQKGAS